MGFGIARVPFNIFGVQETQGISCCASKFSPLSGDHFT